MLEKSYFFRKVITSLYETTATLILRVLEKPFLLEGEKLTDSEMKLAFEIIRSYPKWSNISASVFVKKIVHESWEKNLIFFDNINDYPDEISRIQKIPFRKHDFKILD